MVLGADSQRILQEAQREVILHHPMQHQPDVVLGAVGRALVSSRSPGAEARPATPPQHSRPAGPSQGGLPQTRAV